MVKRRSKADWRTIGGKRIYFRSTWEANYGRYLEYLKTEGYIKDWEHEPKTFWFEGIRRGTVSYLPDFKVYKNNGSHYWVEVKGFMDAKSKTKLKRFAKYFPLEVMEVKDSKWFKNNNSKIKIICSEWEE